ncbi:MAG TPA: thermonuclease family protein [Phycisphaerae bacterium]|nr:thermonuclease family protein [Phycisphaerae bacterium]
MIRHLRIGLAAGVFLYSAALSRADTIVAATNGKVFHTESDCPALKKIEASNRQVFRTVADALATGRRRCRLCEKLSAQRARLKSAPSKLDGAKATSQPVEGVAMETDLIEGEFALAGGERVFPLGICLPLRGQEGHAEAVAAIRTELGTGCIFCGPPLACDRDAFGRRLGYLKSGDDAEDVGGQLLAAGLAWVKRDCVHGLRDEYLQRETEAWQKGLGIWKRLDGEAGRVEVVVGRFAQAYHASDCPHNKALTEPSTVPLNEAKARRLPPCEHYRNPPAKKREREGPTTRRARGKETGR